MRLLIVWVVFVAAGALAPFDFGSTTPVHAHSFKVFQSGTYERDPIDFLVNVLLFVPFGAIVEGELRRRSVLPVRRIVAIALAALAISITIEWLQQFVPSRDSSLIDVIANTLGAVAGIFAARRFADDLTARIRRQRERTSTVELAAALAVVLMVSLLFSGALQARSRLTNWNVDYPLLIGNERTGDRPWHGRVFSVTITDEAAERAAMRRFAADGGTIAMPGRTVAAFTLNGSGPFKDRSGHLPMLAWTAAAPSPSPSGVALTGHPWLQSEGPAVRLTSALQDSNAFSIRIVCAADEIDQDGPARILSNSVSPYSRNFTLGQQGSDLVIRLRTPRTGLNGYPLETFVEGAFATTAVRDIVVSYDGATILAAVARDNNLVQTAYTPATAMAPIISEMSSIRVRASQLAALNVAYIASMFVIPGILVAVLGRSRRIQLTLFAAYLAATSILFEATLVAASGRPFELLNLIETAAIGALVLSVFALVVLPGHDHGRRLDAGWLPAQTWS